MKHCYKCKETKNESDFNKNKRNKDGLSSECKSCHSNYNSKYNTNKDYIKEWRLKNKDKVKKSRLKYKQNNPDKVKRSYKVYFDNPLIRLRTRLRQRIRNLIKSKKIRTNQQSMIQLIGCSLDFLKTHLQETAIKNGYKEFDINNYSAREFHIDHIIPISKFYLKCSFHQKICFHWSNLQILTAEENLEKRDK